MEFIKLGRTGLDVSRIALGCMTYGDPQRGNHAWTLDEQASRPLIARAVELGINFFDTANVYSDGSSEEIVGRALADFTRREETVIATKVHGRMHDGPNGGGLSRKAILTEIDASLSRLGTDYVDLYQIHRWDPGTAIEETLEALHDVVKAGKARYIGASSMYAWQFSKALYLADLHGWTRFVSMQDHYNLLNREEEREMLPFCLDQGVGVLPWSPLARGRLTRDWDAATNRSQTDEFGKTLYDAASSDRTIVDRVTQVAEARRSARPGRPGLASPTPGGHRAHRRRQQSAPSRRRCRGAEPGSDRRGDGTARGAIRPSSRRRVLEATVPGAHDLDHRVDIVAVGGAAPPLDPAAGAAVDEHVPAAFEEYVDRRHEAAALRLAIAGIDVDVLGVEALGAVVRVAVAAVGCAAVLAAEVLDATGEGHDTILPVSVVGRLTT